MAGTGMLGGDCTPSLRRDQAVVGLVRPFSQARGNSPFRFYFPTYLFLSYQPSERSFRIEDHAVAETPTVEVVYL